MSTETQESAPTDPKLDGPRKALLFVLSLEEAVATQILALLTETELRALRKAGEGLKEVKPAALELVHREFVEHAKNGLPPSLKGSGEYLRQLATKALGERTASAAFDDTPPSPTQIKLEQLDVEQLQTLLGEEPPQTVAVVLSQVAPDRAAEVLASLPAERQAEVLRRLSRLESIDGDALRAIESQIEEETSGASTVKPLKVDGKKAATSLVKKLGDEGAKEALDSLAETDAPLAESLRKSLFSFEDILRVDQRGMQALLKSIPTDQLLLAIKTASNELCEKIFSNLSSRAASMLRDERENMGPVRIADVEAAQQAIVDSCLELEREGRLQIQRDGEGGFV